MAAVGSLPVLFLFFSEATGRRPRLTKEINVLYFISFLSFFFFFHSHLLGKLRVVWRRSWALSSCEDRLSFIILLLFFFFPLSVLTDTHAQIQSRSTASTPAFWCLLLTIPKTLFLFIFFFTPLPWSCFVPLRLVAAVMATMQAMPSHAVRTAGDSGPDAAGTRSDRIVTSIKSFVVRMKGKIINLPNKAKQISTRRNDTKEVSSAMKKKWNCVQLDNCRP